MRVVEQVKLFLREGKSDKLYEVDLVESGPQQFLVNFRYGRRGAALREGSKTPSSVSEVKARQILNALVEEKIRGGYQRGDATAAAVPGARPPATRSPTTSASADSEAHAKAAATRRYLLAEVAKGGRSERPLHVVIRKLSDLRCVEAEPYVIEVLRASKRLQWQQTTYGKGDDTRAGWAAINYLARCGTSAASQPLTEMSGGKLPAYVATYARLALAMVNARVAPPPSLSAAPQAANAAVQAIANQLEPQLRQRDVGPVAQGYAAGDPIARSALLGLVRHLKVARSYEGIATRTYMALFRVAEWRGDGDMLAAILRRIDDQQIEVTVRTRSYLRRRVARRVRQLGHLARREHLDASLPGIQGAEFFAVTVPLLTSYADHDIIGIDAKTHRFAAHGPWSSYWALGQILFAHSPSFKKGPHGRAYYTWQRGKQPKVKHPGLAGSPAIERSLSESATASPSLRAVMFAENATVSSYAQPVEREEGFPDVWDAAPEQLWRVLAQARADVVAGFAARALRANPTFCATISHEQVAHVLASGHLVAQGFAFSIAHERAIDDVLAVGALRSRYTPAHAWVGDWMKTMGPTWTTHVRVAAAMCAHPRAEVRAAIAETLASAPAGASDAKGEGDALVATVVAMLLSDALSDDRDVWAMQAASGAREILAAHFVAALERLGGDVVIDLLFHRYEAIAAIGADAVLARPSLLDLPADLVTRMLASPHAPVRLAGGQLVARMPVERVKDNLPLLIDLCISPNHELREGVRGLIGRVAEAYPEVARQLAATFLQRLLSALPEGAPAHLVTLLQRELATCLPHGEITQVRRLLGALSPHARAAGALLLRTIEIDEVDLFDLGKYAHHELLAVRESARALAQRGRDRFALSPAALAKLVDGPWADSQQWGFAFVREFTTEQLAPAGIISILDSIRSEVQAFGRELFFERFREQDVAAYLQQLSEHPSANVQLMVSSLLARYVSEAPLAADERRRRVAMLLPYITRVLSQVQRGQVAKERVLAFCQTEATRDVETARLLAPVLDRMSAIDATTYKYPMIATMVDLKTQFADVPLLLTLVPPQEHS